MTIYKATSLDDTNRIAATIAPLLRENGFLALYGGMGAGKTTLVRGIIDVLVPECTSLVHSPTFAIVNEYAGDELTVYHFDFYRITGEEDLYSTGFYDYGGEKTMLITEWSELIEEAIPPSALRLTIEVLSDGTREFRLC